MRCRRRPTGQSIRRCSNALWNRRRRCPERRAPRVPGVRQRRKRGAESMFGKLTWAAIPFVVGLMNFVVPLQLGVRDVAFPVLNSVSFWLTASGALLINASLVIGNFSRAGWLAYPPLSELAFSPDVGVDYFLWSLQISGIGTLLAGINMVTTILKLRAPGMIYFRMPVFCWTSLASNMLIIAAFPILTATLAMLALDRYLGMHFFTNEAGGNQMMYV